MGRPPSREHGTSAFARREGCKCAPCRLAVKRYQTRYMMEYNNGERRLVDSEPARHHVAQLLTWGARLHQVREAAQIGNKCTLEHLMWGTAGREPAVTLSRDTAARIMALHIDDVLDVPTLVPSVGIRRRFEGLAWLGFSPNDIAPAVGVSVAAIYQQMKSEQSKTETVEAFDRAYRTLREGTGESGFARWNAWRKGWAPPMAWDDETIDDPDATPFPSACIVQSCTRQSRKANLCTTHYRLVREAGGFKEPRRYRPAVQKISKRPVLDPSRLRSQVADLDAVGLAPSDISRRLEIREDYVRHLLREPSDD